MSFKMSAGFAVAGAILLTFASGCSGDDPAPSATGGSQEPRSSDGMGRTEGGTTPKAAPGNAALSAYSFYVDPDTPAADQAERWEAEGRAADARQLRKIGDRPLARWLGTGTAGVTGDVDAHVRRAAEADRMPVLVAYNIPNRDCGSFSAGGAASAAEYKAWIRAVAAGIGSRPAMVILEPDAVAHTVDGCNTARNERYALLSDAIAVLKASGSARVYLDAGHPDWVTDVPAIAGALRQAGVARADGFALNVANFVTTDKNASYGKRVSDALGGAHFVIDTSRNGKGPFPGGEVNGGASWCNPPGRALGPAPTAKTGLPRVDALLWIKRPGESDGACRSGEPPAGQWWPEYALGLATRSG